MRSALFRWPPGGLRSGWDVVLRRPELVTLWGGGAAAPAGALWERQQPSPVLPVGRHAGPDPGRGAKPPSQAALFQGRRAAGGHLLFSVTTQQCPCQAGERVDVAFYLQVNEFRGSRTVQLQVVDLRPSLQSSTREEESLQILRRLEAGRSLRLRRRCASCPPGSSAQAAWRCLRQQVAAGSAAAVSAVSAAAFRRHSRRGSLPAGLLLPGSVLRAGAAEPGDS